MGQYNEHFLYRHGRRVLRWVGALPLALGLCAGLASGAAAQGYGGSYGNPYTPAPGSGGYAAPGGGYGDYGGGGDSANLSVRMDQLQQQIQDLTGRVEELNHQVQTLSRQLNAARNAPPASAPGQASPPPQQAQPAGGGLYPDAGSDYDDYQGGPRQAYPPPGGDYGPRSDAGGDAGSAATAGADGLGAPPRTLGTLPLSANGAQLPARGGPAPANSPEAQYDQAIALLRTENYAAAQAAFKDFLTKNASSPLAGNAQYWLGETFYAQGQYRDAAEAFLQGFQKYPKNSKASASLLKLGMSLGQMKQTKEACLTLNEIPKRYPDAPAMLRQRGVEERKKLGCS